MRAEIIETISRMPPPLQKEVEDFAFFLSQRAAKRPARKLRQDWAGALSGHRDAFTSSALQKKSLDWRTE